MASVILVIHLMLAIAMIGVILLQRSEGGGLGIGGGGGGGGGMSGFLTGRGSANLLTRATAVLAGSFMVTSLVLTILAGSTRERRSMLEDLPAAPVQEAPVQPVQPAQPAQPAVPVQ